MNCCFSRQDSGAGDVYDDHTYVGDHRWPGKPQAYEMTPTSAELTKRYAEVGETLERLIAETGLSGAIYTQTIDVENEVNGLLSYDRRVVKVDAATVAARSRAVIEAGQPG